MDSTSRFQPLRDRGRQALYAMAFVIAIGSLWTISWVNSLDDHGRAAFGEADPSPTLCPAGDGAACQTVARPSPAAAAINPK